ncbi:HAD family hydrolase [Enterococcus gallinarum]|uniref:HAD family hydrolase n=1 Tax=Enterococcus gallinarum TaxID=1353 RepID=UPI00288F6182|nr:HAD family phosphatase [Enterococcus gallinarum]MDT2730400.1 HAD family phosphatase [Enterococcus gallinarum]
MMKAVIFDMDGVVVDTEPIYFERLYKFLLHNDLQPDKEELNKVVGSSSVDAWDIIQNIWGKEMDRTQYDEAYKEFYKDHPINFQNIMDKDLLLVLDWLTKRNYRIGLASSSSYSNIMEVLEQCNISHYFHSVLSGEMFKQSKPHPEIYLKTAEKLQVHPEECLVVEDSTYGITAGKEAGMLVLAKRDSRFNFDQNIADKKIHRLKEVITEVEVLANKNV